MMKRDLAISLIVSLLIALFSYTALSKALDYKSFVTTFLREAVVDAKGAAVIGILVPLLEAMTVLLLIFPRTRYLGLYASFVLLVLFTTYLGYMVLYAPHLPCSCGGVISSLSWGEHIVFNGAFLVLNLIALFLYQKDFYRRSILPGAGQDGRVEKA